MWNAPLTAVSRFLSLTSANSWLFWPATFPSVTHHVILGHIWLPNSVKSLIWLNDLYHASVISLTIICITQHPFHLSFLLPSWRAMRSYRPHLEERDPFKAMTGRTASSSDSLLAEVFGVFLSRKANARRSTHSPRDYFIISLIISSRQDWRDTQGKCLWIGTWKRASGTATLA